MNVHQFDLNSNYTEESSNTIGERIANFDEEYTSYIQSSVEKLQLEDVDRQILVEHEGMELQIIEEINNNEDLMCDIISSIQNEEEIGGLLIGQTRATLEEIYELYCQHASIIGFSVRKAKNRVKQGTNEVTQKYFMCSAAGERNSGKKRKKEEEEPTRIEEQEPEDEEATKEQIPMKKRRTRSVAITRTGCNAMIRAKLNEEGQFEIIQHVIAHNHELTRQQWSHLHRSERALTVEKGETIQMALEFGLKPMQSYRQMSGEAGGEDCLGHTVKDHLNFCYKLKMLAIEGGDAQIVVDSLYQKLSDDPEFFFRVRLDEKGRVCNIFWRDSMMKDDYAIYGDVMIFDTTYRKNKYKLICAPFVGINNHWKNTMFGCAFLGDETIPSFVWLFETFLKAMGGKSPTTIFTDQDQAMSNAIQQVFPEARQRLCQWHLEQNAVSRFGLLKSNTIFKDTFKKCLRGCANEIEFETCWNEMIVKYELQDDKWYKRLYSLRHKWSTSLSKDFFSAGILSSQRSESTNQAIGFKSNAQTNLTEFFTIFDSMIRNWRRNEENDEFNCSRSKPSSKLPLTGLLKHASEVYTHTLFEDFEEEFGVAIGTQAELLRIEGQTKIYLVQLQDYLDSSHKVTYNPACDIIECSCKNFEESGWLYYHCVRILHMHSIMRIPHKYISTRWTKYAKSEVWDIVEKKKQGQGTTNNYTPWRLQMTRKYYNLILKSHKNEAARKIIEESYKRDLVDIQEIIPSEENSKDVKIPTNSETDVPTNSETSSSSVSSNIPTVLDPIRAKTKGSSKRILEKFDKKKSKERISQIKEFGAKTPNAHLF